jgi:probable addiction module antidote protein
MGKTKTIPWDVVDDLKTDEDIALYLEAVFEDGDPALIAHALGDAARAKGMTKVSRAAGLGRESLYKALSADGNPEFATVLKVIQALGLKLKVAA